jgi:hypothetical protein
MLPIKNAIFCHAFLLNGIIFWRILREVRWMVNVKIRISLHAIQKDHVNLPNSICTHAIDGLDPLDREKTINALVIDLTAREMHIIWGNPYQNSYHTYHLDA